MTTGLGTHVDRADFESINTVAMKYTGQPFVMGKPKTAQQGVATTLVAALDPRIAAQTGSYMSDCQLEETMEYATSRENAKTLWKISEDLVGEKFEF